VELKVAKTYRSGAHGPGQDLIEAEESFGKLLVEIIDFLLATLNVGIFFCSGLLADGREKPSGLRVHSSAAECCGSLCLSNTLELVGFFEPQLAADIARGRLQECVDMGGVHF